MQINIENRIIIITGPSTTGKTTLAKMIKESSPVQTTIVSHDAIASKIDAKLSEELRQEEFYVKMLTEISNALIHQENKLIIFDVPGIDRNYIFSLLDIIETVNHYNDEITLIKTNLPLKIHQELMQLRARRDPEVALYFDDFNDYFQNILGQRECFEGPFGSLHANYDVDNEYIIGNPKEITIKFSFPKQRKI